jgi:2,3-dihydroxybenzoate-AMP ligase
MPVPEVVLSTEFTPWPEKFVADYVRKGYWAGIALGELPAMWAARSRHDTALTSGSERRSYEQLDVCSGQLSQGFHSLGVRQGDRVLVQLPNVVELFEVLFGLFRIGAIPVVVQPAYRRAEVIHFCRLTGASTYVVPERHAGFDYRELAADVQAEAPELAHVVVVGDGDRFTGLAQLRADAAEVTAPVVDPADIALLHLSGGTTGTPKLVPRTHNDYLYGASAGARLCEFSESTVHLCALPAAHQFPLSAPGALGTLLSGGTVVLCDQPVPEAAFPLIEREKVTVTGLVPGLLRAWLDSPLVDQHDLSSLRLVQIGGAKLSSELASRVRPEFGCAVQQVYGMTEGLLNFTRLDDPDHIVFGTQGKPLSPDDEIKVVDDAGRDVAAGEPGNLLVRGPYTIRGYYRAPEHNITAFTADGFYRTGDVVRQLPSGHLVVVGRVKDQINRAGQKIAAEEIEAHVCAHPDIVEAAVLGTPDPVLGERTCAYVVSRNPLLTAPDVAGFVRKRGIAAHKIPDRVEFVGQLPRTPVGKIDKKLLRERSVPAAPQPLSEDTQYTGELTADRIRHDIAQALELPEDILTNDAQLLDHGLDSLRLNTLAERWRAAGTTVRFAELAEQTTMAAWVALLVRR